MRQALCPCGRIYCDPVSCLGGDFFLLVCAQVTEHGCGGCPLAIFNLTFGSDQLGAAFQDIQGQSNLFFDHIGSRRLRRFQDGFRKCLGFILECFKQFIFADVRAGDVGLEALGQFLLSIFGQLLEHSGRHLPQLGRNGLQAALSIGDRSDIALNGVQRQTEDFVDHIAANRIDAHGDVVFNRMADGSDRVSTDEICEDRFNGGLGAELLNRLLDVREAVGFIAVQTSFGNQLETVVGEVVAGVCRLFFEDDIEAFFEINVGYQSRAVGGVAELSFTSHDSAHDLQNDIRFADGDDFFMVAGGVDLGLQLVQLSIGADRTVAADLDRDTDVHG